jgi:hypothetical protein
MRPLGSSLLIVLAALGCNSAGELGYGATSDIDLRVIHDDASHRRRLSLVRDALELSSIPIPDRISDDSLRNGIPMAVWTATRNAVAAAFHDDSGSFLVTFICTPQGEFRGSDISPVESANFGKLGGELRSFRRFETKPIRWDRVGVPFFQVIIETAAWRDKGGRLVATEPLIINPGGTPFFR